MTQAIKSFFNSLSGNEEIVHAMPSAAVLSLTPQQTRLVHDTIREVDQSEVSDPETEELDRLMHEIAVEEQNLFTEVGDDNLQQRIRRSSLNLVSPQRTIEEVDAELAFLLNSAGQSSPDQYVHQLKQEASHLSKELHEEIGGTAREFHKLKSSNRELKSKNAHLIIENKSLSNTLKDFQLELNNSSREKNKEVEEKKRIEQKFREQSKEYNILKTEYAALMEQYENLERANNKKAPSNPTEREKRSAAEVSLAGSERSFIEEKTVKPVRAQPTSFESYPEAVESEKVVSPAEMHEAMASLTEEEILAILEEAANENSVSMEGAILLLNGYAK